MHFATLASGSSGNAILVGEGKRHILVDCGVSAKRLLHNLEMLNLDPSGIEGIVITHEHIDHIKGAGILARKLKIPVLATPRIWSEMNVSLGSLNVDQKREVSSKEPFAIAGLEVKLFATSHDSCESYGLKIKQRTGEDEITLGIATDTGTITSEMDSNLLGCDALIVEANHDREKLWHGRYPWHLKKRISSDYGHLENSQLAEGLCRWAEERTKRIVLAHLSEENNTPEIALKTVLQILKEAKLDKKNPDLRLRVAPRHIPHELINIS